MTKQWLDKNNEGSRGVIMTAVMVQEAMMTRRPIIISAVRKYVKGET